MSHDPSMNPSVATRAVDVAAEAARLLSALRAARPLVHNITNYVSMDVAANVLLAIGASPAMVHAPEEVAEFVSFSGALVVNIGTLSTPWIDAMVLAAHTAHAKGIPWVLDPVGAGATGLRNRAVERLLNEHPTIIRGNASEILAVAGAAGIAPKGVDSANTTDEAREAAGTLARSIGAVVIVSGAVDLITDGRREIQLGNGDPIMTQVTALGCALTAVVGAFAAVEKDPFLAAVAATAVYGVAGQLAAIGTAGPGSFRTAFLDELASITPDEVAGAVVVVD